MNIYLAPSFNRAYKKLIRKKPKLASKIKEKIEIFKGRSLQESLMLHKLTGSKHDTWSFSIEEDLRILFYRTNGDVVFVDIGKHEDVY